MSSEEYGMQNVFRYSRKSFKERKRRSDDVGSPRDGPSLDPESPRTQVLEWNFDAPGSVGCSCDPSETDRDIASILHKKCPVISLAEQQLQRLLEGTEKLLCENDRCCRTFYDCLHVGVQLLTSQNKVLYLLLALIGWAFVVGTLLGSASCGSYLGRFDSPILSCIDSFFMSDSPSATSRIII